MNQIDSLIDQPNSNFFFLSIFYHSSECFKCTLIQDLHSHLAHLNFNFSLYNLYYDFVIICIYIYYQFYNLSKVSWIVGYNLSEEI